MRSPALIAMLGVLACSGSRASTTQTTSAQKAAAGSPSLRTVDNAGFVDPAGHTRQVSAGVAPAPVGRGDNPPPLEHEHASGPPTAATAPLEAPTPAPESVAELTSRAARALCDREVYCGRIGAGKPFESEGACMSAKREVVHRRLADASCDEIRGDRVSACLSAIRQAACGDAQTPIRPPPECDERALCGSEAP